MKKFAEHINQEKIKGPIAIYKLGNHRARLGVLTGREVITLHSLQQAKNFLKTNPDIAEKVEQKIREKAGLLKHAVESTAEPVATGKKSGKA